MNLDTYADFKPELITKAHSAIITPKVVKAAKEAGGDEYGACVVYCLLIVSMRRFYAIQP